MSIYSARARSTASPFDFGGAIRRLLDRLPLEQASLFSLIMIGALIAFEIFNYGTTEFAFGDLLGDLRFAGIRWSTILALAFCSMDFAGIARLLTPVSGQEESNSVWYLLGAWFLAATMNALLTWWAVSLALLDHQGLGNEVVGREALLGSVPVFVAVLIWLIRVLIIGTFTMSGNRLLALLRPRSNLCYDKQRTARAVTRQHTGEVPSDDGRQKPTQPTRRSNPIPRRQSSFPSRAMATKSASQR
jgi:hypothetical protein